MRYEKNRFENVDLVLDDNEYVGCTIISCTLVYRGAAHVTFTGNHVSGHMKIRFDGCAGNTIHAMQAIWGMGTWGQSVIVSTFQSIAPGLKKLH